MPKPIQPEQTLEQLRALPSIDADFGTPEGAILCLEDAYRRRNVDAVCVCKDFRLEAILKLLKTDPNLVRDAEVRKKTTIELERNFRKELTGSWPDLKGVESFFVDRQSYISGVVAVTEIQRWPDGAFTKRNLLVANTAAGWHVLNEISDEELEG
ncbi:MAG TPA: hypothetical protein VMB80_15560 [Candidatus Acidoferrum sp.]|nr:hypothetical protein [Candidatus Acidoferrum sp.]